TLPDWLSGLSATEEPAEPAAAAEPAWFTLPEPSDDDAPASEDKLPDWLSGLSVTEEPVETNIADPTLALITYLPGDEDNSHPDDNTLASWLTDFAAAEQPDSEQTPTDTPQTSSSPAEPMTDISQSAAREITIMADVPQKDPKRSKPREPENELDWLAELAGQPLDEPATVPSSEQEGSLADWLADDEGDADETDSAWLDALNPAETSVDQTLDWLGQLGQLDQPEVEEAPTLSWLSDDELRGQATSAFVTSEPEEGEDLEEAMAWLESLVTEQEGPIAAETPAPAFADTSAELNWLDELAAAQIEDEEPAEELFIPMEESPTVVETISLAPTDDEALEDLFALDLEGESAAEVAAAMNWLDELASVTETTPETASELINAGLPPDDPEAAMAWLEQLAAAQAEEDEPDLEWADLSEEETDQEDLEMVPDWLDEMTPASVTESSVEESMTAAAPIWQEPLDELSLEDAFSQETFTLEEPFSAAELSEEAAMDWLDELAASELIDETEDTFNIATFIAEQPLTPEPVAQEAPFSSAELPEEGAMDWLDELAATGLMSETTDDFSVEAFMSDQPLSPESFTQETQPSSAELPEEATMDWLEELAASELTAETDDTFNVETFITEQSLSMETPAWLEQLGDLPTGETDIPPAENGLPDWFDELAESGPDEILPGESLIVEPGEATSIGWLDELTLEQPDETELPTWLDELGAASSPFDEDLPETTAAVEEIAAAEPTPAPVTATYIPPTNISAEAAKILDMSDLFDLGTVEESEEDMAQAMAWMNELLGANALPTTPTPGAAAEPEPLSEIAPAEAEMAWLDELVVTPTSEDETITTLITEPTPTPVAPTPPTPPAVPDYQPPTNISAEAAKILDMSDLFDLGNVEESEEDMAQAMAWMAELMGDLSPTAAKPTAVVPTPEPPPAVAPSEPISEPLAAMDWLDTLAETPAEPPAQPTDDAMDWLEIIVAELDEKPGAAAAAPTAVHDEAMDWLDLIVEDLEEESAAAKPTLVVEEPPTPQAPEPIFEPEPIYKPEPVATQPTLPTPPAQPTYVPPTNISAEAAKILDMSDLFDLGNVEESDEDMAQAMAWMQELMGDLGAPATPPQPPTPTPVVEEIPPTVISATPAPEEEEESAVSWLDTLAVPDKPIAAIPDLDKPFTFEAWSPEPTTPEDGEAVMDWLDKMTAEQAGSMDELRGTAPPPPSTADALFDELSNIPEDPDLAMDWLEQMAAQQVEEPPTTPSPKLPVVVEPRTPSVPTEVMDALAKVETRREKAKTGPLKPPPLPHIPAEPETRREKIKTGSLKPVTPPQPQAESDVSLIKELTSGDVAESLPDWLSLDAIGSEETPLSWLTGRDMDATGWLQSEEAMVDIEPVVDLPFLASTEPIRDEAPPHEPEPMFTSGATETMEFQANLDTGVDDNQLAAARQFLQARKYDEALTRYSGLLEQGGSASPIITELESVVDSHPAQPLLRRLLGDAYMRNGQLQKALETYRKALDQL
ncbi:MAG: hypothetical protein KA314_10770, partial [Chloroflexi bacterium]|nr:hypothetical protein [Chloroflexota bacterium]